MTDVDLSEFYKLSQPAKPPCKLGAILGTGSKLKVAEREQLRGALEQPNNVITGSAVIKWLEGKGVDIPVNTQNVLNHRKGSCTCAKST